MNQALYWALGNIPVNKTDKGSHLQSWEDLQQIIEQKENYRICQKGRSHVGKRSEQAGGGGALGMVGVEVEAVCSIWGQGGLSGEVKSGQRPGRGEQ